MCLILERMSEVVNSSLVPASVRLTGSVRRLILLNPLVTRTALNIQCLYWLTRISLPRKISGFYDPGRVCVDWSEIFRHLSADWLIAPPTSLFRTLFRIILKISLTVNRIPVAGSFFSGVRDKKTTF